MTNSLFGAMRLALADSFNLLFPMLCAACDAPLPQGQKPLCLQCAMELPFTDHFTRMDNLFFKNFDATKSFNSAAALLYYARKTKVQHVIHQLKYKNRPDLAVSMGELLGIELKKFNNTLPFKAIVPVPMHADKLRQRGYNQAERIAVGISNILNVGVETNLIFKHKPTAAQAFRSRTERQTNLQDSFASRFLKNLENSGILIVDDVSTSGATLEAVATSILQNNPSLKLHCVTLAYTVV